MIPKTLEADVLIIGAGIAGLSLAQKLAGAFPSKTVIVLAKGGQNESNSIYAQGGISTVVDSLHDSFAKHIDDTLMAGDGACNRKVVELVVSQGPGRLKELIDWGVVFDRNSNGSFNLHKEGGHSARRILHSHDFTGLTMVRALMEMVVKHKNVNLLKDAFAIDLLTNEHESGRCYGAAVLSPNGHTLNICSGATVLCTGGSGQVFRATTNPAVATGDGLAMAYRAGAQIEHMRFVQFHPTALYAPGLNPTFLISEALRGHGAIIRNKEGRRFLFDTDLRGELASRDVVSLAIHKELSTGRHPCVYLDCTQIAESEFSRAFPTIHEKLKAQGIDPSVDWIPIVPAAHYQCGGISVDTSGCASIEGLYALGECSYTGFHGANRLASNSLLEAVVFAHRCFEHMADQLSQVKPCQSTLRISSHQSKPGVDNSGSVFKARIRDIMSSCMEVVCTYEGLKAAQNSLESLLNEIDEYVYTNGRSVSVLEARNMLTVGYLIVCDALKAEKNQGCFYNIDLQPVQI